MQRRDPWPTHEAADCDRENISSAKVQSSNHRHYKGENSPLCWLSRVESFFGEVKPFCWQLGTSLKIPEKVEKDSFDFNNVNQPRHLKFLYNSQLGH